MYQVQLSQQDAQIILQALGEIPLRVSVNVFMSLQKQIAEQDMQAKQDQADGCENG